MKIIHMSDPHVGYKTAGENFAGIVRRLIEWLRSDDLSAEALVITGDLVHSARSESCDEVRAGLDSLRECGLTVLVVPGNHDYRSGSGHALRRSDRINVKRFQQAFFGQETGYPKLDIIGGDGTAAAFIGLDSMADRFRFYDAVWDHGEFGSEQLRDLAEMLDRNEVKDCSRRVIYFHHHPFEQFPLTRPHDSESLREIIARATSRGVSIDALLYGHNHFGAADLGRWGVARCYNGGTATIKRRPRAIDWAPWYKPKPATRLIDLAGPPALDRPLDLI